MEVPKVAENTSAVYKKNWRNMVLVFRFNASLAWTSIQLGLSKCFKCHRVLTPLAADRAVLWCKDQEDKRRIEKLGLYTIPKVGEVQFVRWNPESQRKNTKIICSNSWLGIEGLPLNMWNNHVFKVIGSKCGGLLDIAKDTVHLNCLTHATIKLKGKEGGLIQESLDIYCWGKRARIRFFNLNNLKSEIFADRITQREYWR